MAYKARFLPGAKDSIEIIVDYLSQFYTGKAGVKNLYSQLETAIPAAILAPRFLKKSP